MQNTLQIKLLKNYGFDNNLSFSLGLAARPGDVVCSTATVARTHGTSTRLASVGLVRVGLARIVLAGVVLAGVVLAIAWLLLVSSIPPLPVLAGVVPNAAPSHTAHRSLADYLGLGCISYVP